ncbi:uncharacterized protein LOC118799687 isoform X2 [Colossoma macropomum]|uniref:uncharacterized protein LOC118799687 isoform X2 n=1 Tax=Colossoma macropomum TaxID=42526 RepID=UPI0018653685|nr:uncharacterized protein LOC118799687 isoform X2 [Colossoma macropomum]
MALFILLSFCLILEVHPQYVPQPQLVVSSTERGSVQLDCKTLYAGVSQCYFYPERDKTNLKHSASCQLSLTDSELTRWTGRSYSPPEPVSVICFYTESKSGLSKPSPHSLPATVTVLVLDQKPVMSVRYDSQYEEFTAVCEMPLSGSVRADFRCNLYTGHLLYLKGESRRRRSGKWSCSFTSSKTDLLNHLQSVKSRELSCDYSLNSDPSARSPMSHTYDISNLIPVPTQPSITEEKSTAVSLVSSTLFVTTKGPTTRLPVVPSSSIVTKMSTIATSSAPLPVSTTTAMPSSTAGTTQTTWNYDDYISSDVKSSLLIIVLSVTGTSVLLAGVMIVFPCRFIKKQRTDRLKVNSARGDQGDMMAVLSVEEFGPGAAGTYSMFTSVTAPYQPSGADRTVYTVVIYSLSTQKQKSFSFF